MPDGEVEGNEARWEWVDAGRWRLQMRFRPDAGTPGLGEGAVEVIDYEVVSESPGRMGVMAFDVEFEQEWRRVGE